MAPGSTQNKPASTRVTVRPKHQTMADGCLSEDVLLEIASGRRRLDADGVEEHLSGCATCAQLLGLLVAEQEPAAVPRQSTVTKRSTGSQLPAETSLALIPTALSSGAVLKDTYTVVRLIGRGGMGEVYEVRHVRLAGRYAVKVLPTRVSGDDELMRRFRREAEITSALRHPSIVHVIDFDRTPEGCVFLAMEYLDGNDLSALLEREGPLAPGRVLHINEQIVSALTAAHRQGVVHRDLKPGNVFVVASDDPRDDRVKLMDFGLSKWSAAGLDSSLALSRELALIGTPRYMAPEQAQGRNRDVSPATDQFALAAMTYEMLAGIPPFSGETLAEVLHAIVYDEVKPVTAHRPTLSPALDPVLARALAKSPDDRYESVAHFQRALRAAVVAGLHRSGVTRARPARGRRRAALAVGMSVFACGLGALGWNVFQGPERPAVPPVAAERMPAAPDPAGAPAIAAPDAGPLLPPGLTVADPEPPLRPPKRRKRARTPAISSPADQPAASSTDAGTTPPEELQLIEKL
jgi:eukaryotic-like serine/threonine-protein kinase